MRITVIGAGAMGGATVEGLLKTGVLMPGDITVSDPAKDVSDRFARKGVNTTADNAAAARDADIVMVFVKPWLVEKVLRDIASSLRADGQMLIVTAAGVPAAKVREWTAGTAAATIPLFLVIPNIAIAELCSMTFIVPVGATGDQTRTVTDLFDKLGTTLLTEERLLPAGTTLASCGIAYAMRYVRAASEGGVEIGFKADDAKKIVLQTVKGAVTLLQADGQHPEADIDKVTTPGGVTIKGLNEMEHAGFTSAVIRGLKAGMR